MGNIAVIATMEANPGKEEELKQELLKLIEPSRADQGCIKYILHQNPEDQKIFIFYEQWESQEALDEHLARPHLIAFKGKAGNLLAGPLDVRVLDILA